MTHSETLKTEIEKVAATLGISPSTVGERAGQGGHFYRRLCEGRRVWPETAAAVRQRLSEMLAYGVPSGETKSHLKPNSSQSSVEKHTVPNSETIGGGQ